VYVHCYPGGVSFTRGLGEAPASLASEKQPSQPFERVPIVEMLFASARILPVRMATQRRALLSARAGAQRKGRAKATSFGLYEEVLLPRTRRSPRPNPIEPRDELRIFVSCAPGLEAILARELGALGFDKRREVRGGFEVYGLGGTPGRALRAAMRLNLHLRTATRVLIRLCEFRADTFSTLKHKLRLRGARLAAFVPPLDEDLPTTATFGGSRVVRATAHKSALYHTSAIEQRVREVLAEEGYHHRFAARTHNAAPPGKEAQRRGASPARGRRASRETSRRDDPGVVVYTRLDHDVCTVSVDATGDPLSDRAYRVSGDDGPDPQATKAPLKSTLAAALAMRAVGDFKDDDDDDDHLFEGDGDVVVVEDPFCGGGTIVVEAALLRAGIAPGLGRRFAFERFPCFDPSAWRRLLRAAEKQRKASIGSSKRSSSRDVLAIGSDRDAGAVDVARDTAARAGVADLVRFECAAFSTALAAEEGRDTAVSQQQQQQQQERRRVAIVSNLPHFNRLTPSSSSSSKNTPDPRDLFASLGNKLLRHRPGASVCLFLGEPSERPFPSAKLVAQLGFRVKPTTRVVTGGVSSVVYTGVVPAAAREPQRDDAPDASLPPGAEEEEEEEECEVTSSPEVAL